MKKIISKTAGFFIPTSGIVSYSHLVKTVSLGEAIDGLLSAVFFSLIFALGTYVLYRAKGIDVQFTHGIMFVMGIVRGILFWFVLWFFWTIPLVSESAFFTSNAFLINSIATFLSGLAIIPTKKDSPTLRAV